MSKHKAKTDHDLTKCGICESIITNPKSLSCLHTYCLACIEDWVRKEGQRGIVTCPICHEKTNLPSGRISDLKTNLFVNTLKDRKLAKDKLKGLKKIDCTSCNDSEEQVAARCMDCKDFLCAKCTDAHATMRLLKEHRVITMDKLHSVMLEKDLQTTCMVHKGQKICVFCETCEEAICETCTVVKHKKPLHTYINLERAYRLQKKDLLELVEGCIKVSHKIDAALEDATFALDHLDDSVQDTLESVQKVQQKALSDFKSQLEISALRSKEEILKWKFDTATTLTETEVTLKSHKAQLDNAIAIATQMTRMGSPIDIATAFPALSNALDKYSKMIPRSLPSRIHVVEFHANDLNREIESLGTLVAGSRGYTQELMIQDTDMSNAKGVAVAPSGDIAVAKFRPDTQVNIFTSHGIYKHSLKNTSTKDSPWDIVVSKEELYYVSNCGSSVTVYHQEGTVHRLIKPTPPFNPFLKSQIPDVRGLAINSKGHVLIGDVKHNFISIHKPGGKQLDGIAISIPPYYLATSPSNKIIVSASSRAGFQILSSNGHRLHNFNNMGHEGLNWVTGICCTSDGIIYVGNRKGKRGIHQFTEDGHYVGCITDHVNNAWGIALIPDEEQLVVVEETKIKLVHIK